MARRMGTNGVETAANGKFVPTFSVGDFKDALADGDMLTTRDIAAAVGCTKETARMRLKKMEENGLVTSQMLGPTFVWSASSDE